MYKRQVQARQAGAARLHRQAAQLKAVAVFKPAVRGRVDDCLLYTSIALLLMRQQVSQADQQPQQQGSSYNQERVQRG